MNREEAIMILENLRPKDADSGFSAYEIGDALNMAIKALEQTRWIPVSERLPEDHDWYVIVVKEKSTGYQYIPRIASHNYDNCWSIIDTEDADKDWLDDLECIAWMPLPQPYMVEMQESDHKCHTCKHYTSGEHDGSCDSYICKEYSNWESEVQDADSD